jgi:general secretion pathway protein A
MSYTDHYGLTAAPFALTPDPRFWFESATHKKAMAYLGYGLQQAEGFVVVTGEIGAGKTTLVGLLMERLDPARVAVVKLVSTQVEGDDVLRLAAQGFDVPTEGVAKAQLLDRIERYLIDRAREGRKTLLIVDEAQNLPVSALEELRMLSNFQSGGRALLQILLLGQPEFRERLASPALEQLRQRVIATHHLDGMNADEIQPYLRHRLGVVGWSGRPEFGERCTRRPTAFRAGSTSLPRAHC